MSIVSFEEFDPTLLDQQDLPPTNTPRGPLIKSRRSQKRAEGWGREVARAAAYLMGQAKTEEELAFVEQLYDKAIKEGPDFLHYRGKSAFQEAAKQGIDRNAYARILNALDMISRGIYRRCREKGKQGIARTVAPVLKVLLNLALHYGRVFPSLVGIARMACVCKQTVVSALKTLELYGFIIIQRRIKRIRTPLGIKTVQDTNAYTIQDPKGLGALALAVFKRPSESKTCPAQSTDIFISSCENAQKTENSAKPIKVSPELAKMLKKMAVP